MNYPFKQFGIHGKQCYVASDMSKHNQPKEAQLPPGSVHPAKEKVAPGTVPKPVGPDPSGSRKHREPLEIYTKLQQGVGSIEHRKEQSS